MATKRCKKADYSYDEILALVNNVKVYWNVLNASFSSSVNNEKKKKCWAMVATAVNAVGKTPRSVDEVSTPLIIPLNYCKLWYKCVVNCLFIYFHTILTFDLVQIRNKWKQLKSSARAAKSAQRADLIKTGGGPRTAPALTDLEDIIISFISETTYQGVKGGRDINAGRFLLCWLSQSIYQQAFDKTFDWLTRINIFI